MENAPAVGGEWQRQGAVLQRQNEREPRVKSSGNQRHGAIRGMGAEVMCEGCQRFCLVVKRCGGCKQTYYCGSECQKNHWSSSHRHVCRHVGGNAVGASATLTLAPAVISSSDSGGGEDQVMPGLTTISVAQRRRLSAASKWMQEESSEASRHMPDARLVRQMQEDTLGRRIDVLREHKWTPKQRHGKMLLGDKRSDVLQGVWAAFSMAGQVPLLPTGSDSRRTLLEIFKFAGSQPQFAFLGAAGSEWVGRYTKHRGALDEHLELWISSLFSRGQYKIADDGSIDYDTFFRLVCDRIADHKVGN